MKLDHGIQGLAPRLGAAMFALSLPAVAQFSFGTPVTYDLGSDPHDVAVGDVDGDGDFDLLTTLHEPARVAVLRNDGNGVFASPQLLALDPGVVPEGLIAPDFDADGLSDIAILSSSTNELILEHNLGNGVFAAIARIPIGLGPTELCATDMDGDGDVDLAVSNTLESTVLILHNSGSTQFDPVQVVGVPSGPKVIAAGKFFGEPRPSLAVAVHDSHAVYMLRNDGTGQYFVQSILTCPNGTHPECVEVADFDEDGDDDVVTTFSEGLLNKFAVYYHTPSEPGFEPSAYFSAPFCHNVGALHPAHVLAADFDLDTRVDVAIVSSVSNVVSILQNQGNTVFGFQRMIDLPGPASDHMALADFDRDYFADFVVTNDGGTSLSVLKNLLPEANPYCLSVPNSTGVGARIGILGSTSIAQDNLTLRVVNGPALRPGLFLHSVKPGLIPFKGSFLCLEPPVHRLTPGVQFDAGGSASLYLPLRLEKLGYPPFLVLPGEVVNFQLIYRDQRNAGWPMTNFSDGLRIVFTP
ncbi:MAG: VCBS repeat-containing protein [Planctomycetes bacterium]|nr:VCBS repeat-containing protein [Planctomycetota bacterium]